MPAAALHPTEDALRPLKILFAGGIHLRPSDSPWYHQDVLASDNEYNPLSLHRLSTPPARCFALDHRDALCLAAGQSGLTVSAFIES